MPILLDLFLTFAKTGLFTFGGGYAMIAVIEDNCVQRKKWISHDEMMNIAVIAESTPGPIAINAATYVGFLQAGFWGAATATVGIVLPSFIIIYLISMFLDNFLEFAVVKSAFKGIQVAVGILILDAGVKMLKKMPKKPLPSAILAGSFAAALCINLFSVRFTSITLMLVCAAVSLAAYRMKGGERR